ncbi:hypothetical protein B0A55_02955 [Friedmanniomyces simplex]|uniref:Major facilitator superfamily (MFS) profile domain-containing protein n=1 Tax=Friedmanniomyces simplex TaxID=329884 RepID=A0A4U0Y434_9PEZI|nr:hypothetical protein B0A55_02955 [Friedmanniomyces simplex]
MTDLKQRASSLSEENFQLYPTDVNVNDAKPSSRTSKAARNLPAQIYFCTSALDFEPYQPNNKISTLVPHQHLFRLCNTTIRSTILKLTAPPTTLNNQPFKSHHTPRTMYPYMMQQRAYQRAALRQAARQQVALEEQVYQQQVFMQRAAMGVMGEHQAEYQRRFGGGGGGSDRSEESRGRERDQPFHGFVEDESIHSDDGMSRGGRSKREPARSGRGADRFEDYGDCSGRGGRAGESPEPKKLKTGQKAEQGDDEDDYSHFLFPDWARAEHERRRQAEEAAERRREEQRREQEAMREEEKMRREARMRREGGRECGGREASRGYDTEEIRPSAHRGPPSRRSRYDDEEEEMPRGYGQGNPMLYARIRERRCKSDILGQEALDPVLNAKMHLVNNAIDEIGMTGYQWKLFVLTGFGYAVDSLMLLVQSIIATYAAYEFNPAFPYGLTIAVYVGMLVGALFWGLSADVIGRKYAFNYSLLISSVFCIVAGASPNWVVLGLFVCLSAFGSGGNLVLDTAVFLEYLPSKDQWLLTLMACWWGLGQLIAGLFAWAFLPNYSCPGHPAKTGIPCNWKTNPGWRYVWFANGALVLVMSLLRITVIRLRETPKYLLGEGRDAEVIDTLHFIATKYHRPCSLTLAHLSDCGVTDLGARTVTTSVGTTDGRRTSTTSTSAPAHASRRFSFAEVLTHLRGLHATRRLSLSTSLIWLSWLLIGLAYPLYNVFLPTYLATRGAALGGLSVSDQWRNYAVANLCGIPSPILAGFMCRSGWFWGRRGTMVIGALVTMAFFFAYTQVKSNAENLGFTCAIGFCLNIYYGTLYAYTPEVLPSAHRGTGNGISIALNRLMGILSAVIATYANTATPVPIYLCAALYIVMAGVAAVFPFEPMGSRSS